MIMVVVEAMAMMIVELHGQRVTVPTGIPQGKPAIDNCHFQVFPDDTEGAEMSEGGSSNLLTSTVVSLSYSVLAKRWQHRSVGRAASRAPS